MASRRSRFLIRSIITLALLCAAALLFYALALPAIAHVQVRQAFRGLGAPISSFEVDRIGLGTLRLANISLGEPVWLSASAIDVRYGFDVLWTGRLRTIEVHDPEWFVMRDERGIHFGPEFDDRSPQLRDQIDLPFDRLIVHRGDALLTGFSDFRRIEFGLAVNRRSEGTAEAQLQLARIVTQDSTLPGTTVFIELDGTSIQAVADWEPIPSAMVDLRASVSIEGERAYGEIIANVPPFEISNSGAIQAIVPAMREFDIGGTWAARAHVAFAGGAITPTIRLTAHCASLHRSDWLGELESFSGEFTISSFAPMLLEGTQRIEIHKARWADMPIEDGQIEFSMHEPNFVAVHSASWSMGAYGEFEAAAFDVNLAQPEFQTRIVAQDLGLDAWLKRLSDGRVHGEGQLHGWANVAYRPATRQKVFIGDGALIAAPDGWIQTADRELVHRIVAQSDAAFSRDPQLAQVRDRLVAALQNYAFSRFDIHLVPQSDGLEARIETAGRGRTGPQPQEVSLNLNISGFDQLVSAAIQGRSLWESRE